MKVIHIILFVLGINLVINGNIEHSFGQTGKLNNGSGVDTKLLLQTNSLNLSQPIYQAITSDFFDAQSLPSKTFPVTKESVLEQAVMRDIGNVTNNMTFINTHLPDKSIQAKGNGTIETRDGQTIDWISSDVGMINSKGPYFYGIILFNNTNGEKLSFLSNTTGFYKESPDIKRTMWLIK